MDVDPVSVTVPCAGENAESPIGESMSVLLMSQTSSHKCFKMKLVDRGDKGCLLLRATSEGAFATNMKKDETVIWKPYKPSGSGVRCTTEWSMDGRLAVCIYSHEFHTVVRLFNIDDSHRENPRYQHTFPVSFDCVRWAHSGEKVLLYSTTHTSLALIDFQTHYHEYYDVPIEPTDESGSVKARVLSASWKPSSESICISVDDGSLWHLDTKNDAFSGTPSELVLKKFGAPINMIKWGLDGMCALTTTEGVSFLVNDMRNITDTDVLRVSSATSTFEFVKQLQCVAVHTQQELDLYYYTLKPIQDSIEAGKHAADYRFSFHRPLGWIDYALARLTGTHPGYVPGIHAVAVSLDGSLLALETLGRILVCNMARRDLYEVAKADVGRKITQLAISDRYCAAFDDAGVLKCYEILLRPFNRTEYPSIIRVSPPKDDTQGGDNKA